MHARRPRPVKAAFDPDAAEALQELPPLLQDVLGESLVGLYLYGSLATGDFDPGISDIDLVAVAADALTHEQFERLGRAHEDFVRAHPGWGDRVEVAYVRARVLRTFKTERSDVAVISPGEPFHMKDAGRDWATNWFQVRETGITLLGPPPGELIEPVSEAEFRECIREYALEWRTRADELTSRPWQAYAILTLCRALHTLETGEQASKRRAAAWAAREIPEWAPLIRQALEWREAWREQDVDPALTLPETRRFIENMTGQIVAM